MCVGDDKNIFFRDYFTVSIVSKLQKRITRPEEIKELFGLVLSALWPETASNTTGHDDAVIIVGCHDDVRFKVSAKLDYFFIFTNVFMINDVRNTFFEEKMQKNLVVCKNVVPLHPQMRNNPRF